MRIKKPTPIAKRVSAPEAPAKAAKELVVAKKTAAAPVESTPVAQTIAKQPESVKETKLSVKRTVVLKDAATQESDSSESFDVRCFATQPATVSYGASVKKSDGNYGSVSVSIHLAVPCYVEEIPAVYDDVRAKVHALLDQDAETLGINDSENSYVSTKTETTEDSVEEEAVSEDDGAYTEDDIKKMSKAELVALVKEQELDIDTSLSIKELRGAVIALLSDDDYEETTTNDSVEGDDTETESGEELSEDDINDMSKEELIALIDDNALPINSKLKESELRNAIIAYMQHGDDAVAEDVTPADESEEVEEDDTDGELLTKEQLEEYSTNDLKSLAKDNEIVVKVKQGATEKQVRSAYITAILDYQNSFEE